MGVNTRKWLSHLQVELPVKIVNTHKNIHARSNPLSMIVPNIQTTEAGSRLSEREHNHKRSSFNLPDCNPAVGGNRRCCVPPRCSVHGRKQEVLPEKSAHLTPEQPFHTFLRNWSVMTARVTRLYGLPSTCLLSWRCVPRVVSHSQVACYT